MSFEICIGKYQCPEFTELNNKDAHGFYDFRRSLFALAPKSLSPDASNFLESILLQLLNRCPINGMKIYLFQSIASKNFNAIKRVYATKKGVLGEQFFNEQAAGDFLKELSESVNRRYADFAAVQVDNVFSYNQSYKTTKPLIFYIIDNAEIFLQKRETASTFRNIINQGALAGIYVVIQYNDEEYQKSNTYHSQNDSIYELLSDVLPNMFGINLYSSIDPVVNMDYRYSKFIKDLGYRPIFNSNFINSLADGYIQKTTASTKNNTQNDFIKVKIGESQNHDVHFAIGPASMSYYTLISGGAGSGKSMLLTDIVLRICEQHSPDEVQIILIDFSGVTFNLFEDSIAHIPFSILSTSEVDKINAVFDYIEEEGVRRSKLFSELSNRTKKKVDNIHTYRSISNEKLPIIILFFDELQKLFFLKNRKLPNKASRFFNTIANELRKYGIFMVLATQSYNGIDGQLDDYFANCNVRIGLKANRRIDFNVLMSQSNDGNDEINNTQNSRQLIFNNQSGDPDSNILVDINVMSDAIVDKRLNYLKQNHPINSNINLVNQAIVEKLKSNQNTSDDDSDDDDSLDDSSFDDLFDGF